MKPKTFSASAGLTFQGCEARYKANYIDRTPELSGTAANLGTAAHEALERLVKEGLHFPQQPFEVLRDLFDEEYAKLFSDNSRRAEGRKFMKNWWDRSGDDYWAGREVLSTEHKTSFDLKTSEGIMPFTYILDRCDRLEDGTIDIIDYKSVAMPVQPQEMMERIQPRAYALAAQIAYPDAPAIWMSFDLLRYDIVGAKFSREDNIETYRYLQSLVEEVYASDGTKETLNPECRWCVRKAECDTLLRHMGGGGVVGMDADTAADLRSRLDWQRGAISKLMDELDEIILEVCEDGEMTEFKTNETKVTITASARREADSERIIKVIGPEIAARYGKIGVTDLDKILANEELTDEQKSEVRQLVRKKYGNPRVKTKALHPFGEAND